MNWTEAALLLALVWTFVLLIRARAKATGNGLPTPVAEPDVEQLKEAYDRSIRILREEKIYLQKNLKVSDLSARIRQNEKVVSKSINHFEKENFNSLINRYRVQHAKEMMLSGKYSHYTIEAIADECGFSNKVSFYNAFKSQVGMSPKEFWAQKQLRN